jgi:hypothetical protein
MALEASPSRGSVRTGEIGADAERYDLNGVPLFHLPLPGATTIVTVAFGTGRADDPPHLAGLTHLSEHLVMGGIGDLAIDGNGATEMLRVLFTLHGSPDDASQFLRSVGRSICEPALDRCEAERSVLRTEEDSRGGRAAVPVRLAWNRFGHSGLGAAVLPEFAARHADRATVAGWIGRHLVRGNAAILVAGILPADLVMDLPEGERYDRPPMVPIDGLRTPTLCVDDMPGLGASFVVARTAAIGMALRIAERRLRRSLRIERSLGYAVDLLYMPITADTAHAALYATCELERVAEVEGVLLNVLDELAIRGAWEEEITREVERARLSSCEPMAIPGRLDSAVRDHLLGRPLETLASLHEERAAVDRSAIAAAMKRAMASLVLAVPRSGFVPNRSFEPYPPASSIAAGDSRSFPAASGPRKPWQPRPAGPRLVVGSNAVFIGDSEGQRLQCVPWVECVAYVRDPGRRLIYGRDGYTLGIDQTDWEEGATAIDMLDRFAPAAVTAG